MPGIVTACQTVSALWPKNVACVDRTSGKESWNSPDADTSPFGHGLLVGTRLIIATDKSVTAWNVTTGVQIWRTAATVQGLVDVATDESTLYAEWLEPTTQTIKIQADRRSGRQNKMDQRSPGGPRAAGSQR